MQFQANNPISASMSEALVRWMQALDGSSEILVDADTRQIQVSSRLSRCFATSVSMPLPQSNRFRPTKKAAVPAVAVAPDIRQIIICTGVGT